MGKNVRPYCGQADTGGTCDYVYRAFPCNNLAVFMSHCRSSIDVTEIHCHGDMFYSACDIRSIRLNLTLLKGGMYLDENLGNSYGVTLDEATEAMKKAMSLLPPPGATDIILIKANPSLNWFQKWKLCRFIKRMWN